MTTASCWEMFLQCGICQCLGKYHEACYTNILPVFQAELWNLFAVKLLVEWWCKKWSNLSLQMAQSRTNALN